MKFLSRNCFTFRSVIENFEDVLTQEALSEELILNCWDKL